MGLAIFKGNEDKSKMKHPSDMPTARFEQVWNMCNRGGPQSETTSTILLLLLRQLGDNFDPKV